MGGSPSTPAPNYEQLWSNYSGWLREATSRYKSSSAWSRARSAAGGVGGATPTGYEADIKSSYQKELEDLYGGYSARTVKEVTENRMYTGFKNPKLRKPFESWGIFKTRKAAKKTYHYNSQTGKWIATWEEEITIPYEGNERPADRPPPETASKSYYEEVPEHEVFGYGSKEEYQAARQIFKSETGKEPEFWEMYLYSAYGLGGSTGPTEKEQALQRAQEAAGQRGGDQARRGYAGATPRDEQTSPWM